MENPYFCGSINHIKYKKMEILIVKSAITQALQNHIDTQEDLVRITTDGQDDVAVAAELSSIGSDYSMYGSTSSGASGSQSSGILIPIKAV